jgi:uncharacterized membrane protein YkvA (DUF1232 family)
MLLRALYQLLSMTGIPRLVFKLVMDRRVPLSTKLIVVAGLAYFISPIDLLSERMLPVFGRVDDLLAIVLSIALFLVMAPKEVVAEHIRGDRPGPGGGRSVDGDSRSDAKVVDGSYRYLDDDDKPRE